MSDSPTTMVERTETPRTAADVERTAEGLYAPSHCSAFVLDECVADGSGEATGQCANCGGARSDHASSAFRHEPYGPTVYLEIYDKQTGHHLRGWWRPDRVKDLANLILGWVEEGNAQIRNDWQI